jgi:hypothetical protein
MQTGKRENRGSEPQSTSRSFVMGGGVQLWRQEHLRTFHTKSRFAVANWWKKYIGKNPGNRRLTRYDDNQRNPL